MELDHLRCSNGFTAFTPSYPTGSSIDQIFAFTPYSKFGVVLVVLAVFLTQLTYARLQLAVVGERKRMMEEMSDMIHHSRDLQRHMKKCMDIEETVAENLEAELDHKGESLTKEERLDKAVLKLRREQKEHLTHIIEYMDQDEAHMKRHLRLLKSRVENNQFIVEYNENQAEYYGIVIGLSFELVIDALTEYWSSCDFLHSQGSDSFKECLEDNPLQKAQRVLVADFVGAFGTMLLIMGGLSLLIRLKVAGLHEEEKGGGGYVTYTEKLLRFAASGDEAHSPR